MAAASLARKRAQERTVREREIFLKDEFNATCVARWEQRTSTRIERQDLINRAKIMAENDARELQERQIKIEELYEREELQLKKELEESTYVSIEDRIKAIREKASRLQEKRAKEKEDFVNTCYDRQWRDGCDDVRALNAKAITEKLVFDRNHALDVKQSDFDGDKEDEKNQLIQEFERKEKEKEKEIERQRKNKETILALDEQVRINRCRKEGTLKERQKEEDKQLERWNLENEMGKEKKLKALKEAHARGEQTMKSNEERLRDRERTDSQKRKEESIMLDYALEKERKEIDSENKQRQQHKGVSEEYRTFLQQQMIKDEKDTNKVESVRDEAMNNIWQRRDADMKAKNDARNKLMLEVNASRDEQIREKNRRAEEMKRNESIEVENNIKLWEKERQCEQDKEEKQKQRKRENMLWNKKLMEDKLQQESLEKQKQFLLQKQMARTEQDYQARVEREAGRAKTYFPRRGEA